MSGCNQCEGDSPKMFVGQLPRSMDEDQLKSFLSKYGEIFEVVLLRDRNTNRSRGCCFATFVKRESALAAQNELHNKYVFSGMRHPVQMKVADSEVRSDERKLFVGMIPKRFGEGDLREMFSAHGEIEDLVILTGSDGKSKGCGFVTFATNKSAICAIQALHQTRRFDGCSGPVVVKVADNTRQRELRRNSFQFDYDINMLNHHYFMQRYPVYGCHYSSPLVRAGVPEMDLSCANISVYYLPEEYTDGDLASMFSPFGRVMSAKVYVDVDSGRSRCFGTVCYDYPASACVAAERMDGFQIGDKRLKVQLRKSKENPY